MCYPADSEHASRPVKKLARILVAIMATLSARAGDFDISSLTRDGTLILSNAFTNGVVTVERAAAPGGPWTPEKNIFSVCSVTQLNLTLSGGAGFFRSLAVDLSGESGFTNLVESYGLLTTVAGSGLVTCINCGNNWQPSYEGGPATNA